MSKAIEYFNQFKSEFKRDKISSPSDEDMTILQNYLDEHSEMPKADDEKYLDTIRRAYKFDTIANLDKICSEDNLNRAAEKINDYFWNRWLPARANHIDSMEEYQNGYGIEAIGLIYQPRKELLDFKFYNGDYWQHYSQNIQQVGNDATRNENLMPFMVEINADKEILKRYLHYQIKASYSGTLSPLSNLPKYEEVFSTGYHSGRTRGYYDKRREMAEKHSYYSNYQVVMKTMSDKPDESDYKHSYYKRIASFDNEKIAEEFIEKLNPKHRFDFTVQHRMYPLEIRDDGLSNVVDEQNKIEWTKLNYQQLVEQYRVDDNTETVKQAKINHEFLTQSINKEHTVIFEDGSNHQFMVGDKSPETLEELLGVKQLDVVIKPFPDEKAEYFAIENSSFRKNRPIGMLARDTKTNRVDIEAINPNVPSAETVMVNARNTEIAELVSGIVDNRPKGQIR
ncbi:hypothetical protein RyT2_20200 [Pseudolactococcus yaeyamensis]